MKESRKIFFIFTMFIVILIVGTIGYMILIDISFIDALYMTVITISTVGYQEVGEMNDLAKIFSIIMIFWGVGTAGYTFTTLVIIFIEGEISDIWRNRKMENKISKLSNHYILCGAGETGEVIVDQFLKKGLDFVVIENDEEIYENLMAKGILVIFGDATEESVLEHANIKKAKGLVSALSKDVDNVFTVLTARQMNKDMYIISRAIDKSAPNKLKKAGANNTISANEIGGRRMAALMIRPSVISFLDVITHVGSIELDLEDVVVMENSYIVGKSLMEIKIPEKIGLIVLAVKKHNQEEMMFNPSSDLVFDAKDTMLVLGTEEQVNELRELANDDGERLPCLFC